VRLVSEYTFTLDAIESMLCHQKMSGIIILQSAEELLYKAREQELQFLNQFELTKSSLSAKPQDIVNVILRGFSYFAQGHHFELRA